ncbi:Flp family type IVb pilin [Intestinirhabdus alba]|jgi:pilus assembly protein Flp/PilA|uniref:Flp family type IVb pilin n=1 Tax=Intestinirhabdus alba TaxID=2899544 RepID=A0A6L6IKJ7_9ENTR|nr:Flp family type IVb pilin [Intestinirhabdus alba]MTH45570.1 Flp family type IVb pilin [Intestinirhabdus alba]
MNNLITKCYVATLIRLEQFGKDRRGVTAIEYALIGVAMATLLAYILGDQNSGFLGELKKAFDAIAQAISQVTISSSNP